MNGAGSGTVTGHTRAVAVIGDPVRHSLSPAIHNAAFAALGLDWVYLALPVPAGRGADAVRALHALGLEGCNVTMPHKEAAAEAVDRLTPVAARLGAVNTVFRDGRELVGDNTDAGGFLASLLEEGIDPAGRRCVVVGAGGAARAVVVALADGGAADVAVLGRTAANVERAAAVAPVARVAAEDDIGTAHLVVNATPVGMGVGPVEDPLVPIEGTALPFDPGRLRVDQAVVDLVYWPPVTPLLATARAAGCTTANGLGMLLHQAAAAFRRWTGEEPPLGAMSAAALAEIAKM